MAERTIETFGVQADFVEDASRECLYIGGVGSGKSFGGAVKGLSKAIEYPGIIGIVAAPTYPMLRDATLRSYQDVIGQELWTASVWRESELQLVLPWGSEILFRSTHHPARLRGPSIGFVHYDEAAVDETPEAYDVLLGRLRQPDVPHQIWLTTTPKGYNWVYELTLQQGVKLFHAPTTANPHLDEKYIESLKRRYRGQYAEQELNGLFVQYEGLVYGDFKLQVHTGEVPYNERWPVDLAWDFGGANPTAVLAIQQDASGNVYVIDEIYRSRVIDEDIVVILRGKPYFEHIADAVCDSAAPDRIQRLQRLGVPARPANKGRIADGVEAVRALLINETELTGPRLRIDRENCQMLIKEFGQYRYADPSAERNRNEEPVDAWNHALDALRYWVVTKHRPSPTTPAVRKAARRVLAFQRMR